jgi:heptosyltransferase-2
MALAASLIPQAGPMDLLVIRFSSLGDVILATGAVRALRSAHPDARVTLLTKPVYRAAVRNVGVPFDLPELDSQSLISSARRTLRGRPLDWIFDLHGSLRSILLSHILRARHRRRIEKQTKRRQAMVKHKEGLSQPLSVLEMYRAVISPLLSDDTTPTPRLFLSEEEAAQATTLRSEGIPGLGIGWGARWATKAVPPRIWTSLLASLPTADIARVYIFGTEDDRATIESFVGEQAILPPSAVRIECGLDLRSVMVKVASCNAFVSSDSGLMHLSAALGVPTLGLFGPTHPALGFAPIGAHAQAFHAGTYCSPCHRHGAAPCFRERRFCFDELNIPRIAGAVADALNSPWSLNHESAED